MTGFFFFFVIGQMDQFMTVWHSINQIALVSNSTKQNEEQKKVNMNGNNFKLLLNNGNLMESAIC